MLNAIAKLVSLILIGWFLIWATYKIGAGLGYWSLFVMVIIGMVGGLIYGIAKLAVKKNSKK